MSEENNINGQESAGCFGIVISLLIPLVGFILYFVKKNEMDAKPYLYAALIGMVINGFVLAAGA